MDDPSKLGPDAARRSGSSRRSGSRMRVAGKLTALLGLPLLILFVIFSAGVYCGVTRADRVVAFEQRWLGVDPPPGRLVATDADAVPPTDSDEPPETPPDAQPAAPADTQPAQPPVDPPVDPPIDPQPRVEQAPVESPPVTAPSSRLLPVATAPIGPELRARFDEPRVVRLKLMVDPALVDVREDWLGYIVELFEVTRVGFERLFGIELLLQGVVVWDAPSAAAGADELLADLATRERDGAEVMIGFVARAQPPDFEPKAWTESVTGDHALVFADRQQHGDRYYRGLLRALALLFGAEPTHDAAATQLGSFMSEALTPAGAAPTLDPENRGKVIIHKRRPIADSRATAGGPQEI
jgi:hypothetical protein